MQTLQVERSDGIVTITLDRPEKRNAVSSQMWAELQAVATELATSDDRCVVLTGAGGAFCSGADLWEADAPRVHPLAADRSEAHTAQLPSYTHHTYAVWFLT